MAIGQGAYGRGGLVGGAARSSQTGKGLGQGGLGSHRYKAQDARSYLTGQDQVDYDKNVGYLNEGYTGSVSFDPWGGGNTNESQRNYMGATATLQALRKKAADTLRSGGAFMYQQAEGASYASKVGLPSQGTGGLFKPLEIDQGWMIDKNTPGKDASRDYSKPWMFGTDEVF